MAKLSLINRQVKREQTVKKYMPKRKVRIFRATGDQVDAK